MNDIGPIFRALTRNKLGALLIALQIALTLAIVTNAAFIIQERAANIARPSGLDEPNTSLFITNLFDSNVDQRQLYRDDLAALRSIPGVVAATPSQSIPISGSGWVKIFTTIRNCPPTSLSISAISWSMNTAWKPSGWSWSRAGTFVPMKSR